MSSETDVGRNRLVVPAVALGILALVVAAFWLTRGGDGSSPQSTPTAPTTSAEPHTATDRLTGSGDAPEGIAVKAVTVARSATGFGLAADIPKIDLKKFDSVTLTVGQDNGDVLWDLSTVRDPRGTFISPELRRTKNGKQVQFACPGAALRIKATRITITLPLQCLDSPTKSIKARLSVKDRDGDVEMTSTSKSLPAQK